MLNKIVLIILAGFIILLSIFSPIPRIIPSASSVVDSIKLLFTSYDVLFHIFYSITTLFSNLLIANVILAFVIPGYISSRLGAADLNKFPLGILYISAFLMGIYIVMIFPSNHYALSIILAPMSLIVTYNHLVPSLNNIRGESVDFHSTVISGSPAEVRSMLVASLLKSRIYDNFRETLNTLWVWLLMFEFLSGYNHGLGALMRLGFEYWSLPLFVSSILVTITAVILLNYFISVTLDFIKIREMK